MHRWSRVTTVGEALLDLVAPRACAGCGAPLELWCRTCDVTLSGPAWPTVPSPCPAGFPPTWAVSAYGGGVRDALLAHKERGRLGLAKPLGAALARSAEAALVALGGSAEAVVLVPVPSSRAATRARGHDPLLRTAREAAYVLRASGRPVAAMPLLIQARVVADQSGLGSAARATNLTGAHRVRARLASRLGRGALVIVVDDLVTTGASLVEAGRALQAAGLTPDAGAVVAATVRRQPLDRSGRTV